MPRRVIERADHFDDDDELEGAEPVPSSRPYMPMDEADAVRNNQFPTERHISPKVLLEQERARTQQLEADLEQARAAGQALAADGSIVVQGFQLTPAGLILPDEPSFEAWEQVGHLLFRLEGSIQWMIGDWLIYGEHVEWGKTDEIAKALGREAQTLYHYKSVCQKFEFCRRRQNLTFGHHEAVRKMSIQEQDQALDEAEARGLSVASFRKFLKGDAAPALSADGKAAAKLPSMEFEKFLNSDPTKAKPADREKAWAVRQQMRQALDAFDRAWGFE